jgi:tRNA pseudouridine38-40 synthase
MVRIITGTLLEMGTGKKDPEEMKVIIESMDRSKAGHTAPAEGLYLKEIYF